MTHAADIAAEFVRIEAEANKTPRGADHQAILRTVAAKFGVPLDEAREAVKRSTFTEPS